MSIPRPFVVQFTSRAQKDLRRLAGLEPRATRIVARRLSDDPEAGHGLTGELRDYRSLEFSMPGGAYRAAYRVYTQERTCLVIMVGPHEGFYERLRRRVE